MSSDAPWPALRRFTEARIGLGRAGSALPIKEVLSFAMAHAQARDAVTTPIHWAPIEKNLAELGQKSVRIDSAAADRNTYLRRPDLGRRLAAKSRERLAAAARPAPDLLIVVADGLSSTGVAANATDVIAAGLPGSDDADVRIRSSGVTAARGTVRFGSEDGR